ncbi:RraA-like protein [Dentipellis sp. KUC8613]|nr:RraA-like protein [Dentipellis sp. KUC8613]
MSTSPLSDFSTCELSDALLKLQVLSGGLIPSIQMLSPSPHSEKGETTRLCGPAFPVRMVLSSDTTAPSLGGGVHFVDLIPEGQVAFIDAPPKAKNAVWGGLMTSGAQARSAPGVIVSGFVRDTLEHRATNFPVFSRGTSTVGQKPYTRVAEVGVPVTVRSGDDGFPDVTVHPGDWLVADVDGVVCIPKELVEEVGKLATKGREVDAKCEVDIKKGLGVGASFKKHRGK